MRFPGDLERLRIRLNPKPAWAPWLLVAAIPLAQLPFLLDWQVGFNSDHAVPYLMARHVLGGEHRLFFWGNRYMGALEAYAGAALMWLFRNDAPWWVDLVPLSAYVATAAILVGRAPPDQRFARAILLLLPPPALFVAIDRPGFSQGAILWLGWAAFIALRPALADDPLRPRAFGRALAAGAVLALACFYIQTALIAAVALALLLPLAVAIDVRDRAPRAAARTLARIAQAGLAIGVGALGYASTRLGPPGVEAHLELGPPTLTRLRLLGDALLQFSPWVRLGPTIPGLTTFYGGVPAPPPGSNWPAAATPLALGLLALLGLAAGRGVGKTFAAAARSLTRREGPFPFELVLWAAVGGGLALAFVLSGQVWDFGSARYLTPLAVPVLLFAAEGVRGLDRRIALALGAVWLLAAGAGEARTLGVDRAFDADIGDALRFAESQSVDGAVADYWLGYVVAARSRERLVASAPSFERYPPYAERVARARRVASFGFRRNGWPPPPAGRATLKARRTFGEVAVDVYER